ncbi:MULTISPECIES: hypothetical protein [unclassified Bacillus (in: firmicutes)]|jgi:hypothetical protein|uniref:hypothetical protein n=1 Tax=Bacillaceae TaxID=186817 RepID=UPI0006B047A2|nr:MULTISPECIES: hypothetical protein [unclassified Bacillus (in: firmicutes)]ALC85514.1 hypothetical protein AM499_06560 [Bacillus sp. FJAT-22090]MDF2066887.1 hypothetical protein [Bacillus sp. Cr_A10]
MAFGITRDELNEWKRNVHNEQIAFLTHYWVDKRFPGCNTVTKVGCSNLSILIEWGKQYGLKEEWIDFKEGYPHFDLFGKHEYDIMKKEGQLEQLKRFKKA